jgi:hypothetical protein
MRERTNREPAFGLIEAAGNLNFQARGAKSNWYRSGGHSGTIDFSSGYREWNPAFCCRL